MTLHELFDHGVTTARTLFDAQGELHAMWIAENNDTLFPIVAPITDKNLVVAAIRAFFEEKNVQRYVSIIEGWTVECKTLPESYLLGGSLASHPERREIVMIGAEDNQGNQLQGVMYILRPEHGKPKLSEIKTYPVTETAGRFTHLLRRV